MPVKNPHAPYFPRSVSEGGHDSDEISLAPYMIEGLKTREMVAAYYNKVNDADTELGTLLKLINEQDYQQQDSLHLYQ